MLGVQLPGQVTVFPFLHDQKNNNFINWPNHILKLPCCVFYELNYKMLGISASAAELLV